MRRVAIVLVALALGAPAGALAKTGQPSSASRRPLAFGGRVASIDGKAKLAVLSTGGAKGGLVAVDLSHATVRIAVTGRGAKAGPLTAVRVHDHVLVTLKVSANVARRDAKAGISVPVARLLDQCAPHSGSAAGTENPIAFGLVRIVTGEQVTIALGDGPSARTITLDLTGAQVFAGHPPVAADAGSVAAGDRVLANLGVSSQTVGADVQSGTAVPVSKLYDLGAPKPPPPPIPVILGGRIVSIGSGQLTISLGNGDRAHTAVLDISAATIYAGSRAASATVTTVSALNSGDVVYAVLSVSAAVASGDVQSDTPIPVAKLYDAGAPTPPAPPAPPAPPVPPKPVIYAGSIVSIGSGQLTISFGDSGNIHSAILDISSATIYAGARPGTATVTSAGSLKAGDVVYAVLSVTADVASSDVQSGTPIPVAKLYDTSVSQPPAG